MSIEAKVLKFQKEFVTDRQGRLRQAGTVDPGGDMPDKLKFICEKSLYSFAVLVLGRGYLTAGLHRPICNWLSSVPVYRKLLLLPRRHAKTSIVSHALPLHILVQPEGGPYMPWKAGCDVRVLLAGETETRATDNLRVLRNVMEGNELFRGLWPHLCWENPRREADKWNERMLVVPRNEDYPDPSVRAIGVGGAITGARHDVHIKDDLVSEEAANSEVVMQAVINWHVNSRALFDDPDRSLEYVIGCVTADVKVSMVDGTKKAICEVSVGDSVWSPAVDGSFSVRRVERVIPQGFAPTLTVKTTINEVTATENHPFLVSRGTNRLEWVRADQLRVGDQVVAQKAVESGVDTYDEEFVWLLGVLFGDGWVNTRSRRGYVCFCPGVDDGVNTRVLVGLRKYVSMNKWTLTTGGYYRCDTVEGARFLASLGLCAGAKLKRVPDWVYRQGQINRVAFLRGFIEADGSYVSHSSYRVEIANRELLEDLQYLASLCGVRTGKISYRRRLGTPPNSPRPVYSDNYGCSFNFATIERCEQSGSYNLTGGWNIGRDTRKDKNLRFVRVEKIVQNSVLEPVWDLTVEGNPAFMANGLAVHNTRWAVHDLYSYIMQNDPTVSCLIRSIVEDGKTIYPEAFGMETVERLRREFGVMFSLLYMNNIGDPDLVDFTEEDLRFFSLVDGVCEYEEDVRDAAMEKVRESLVGPFVSVRGEVLTEEVLEEMGGRHMRDTYFRFRG